MNGLYLANNYTNLLQWAFPTNASIGAGQFEVIFADGLTNLSTTNELHANFVLPSGTGSLALTRLANNGQQQVLDYVDYQNINLPNDSYGSFPDGQSFNRQEFFQATPGARNNGTATPPPSFIAYTAPALVYTQNFDSLPDPGATSVNSGNPVTINGITYSLANPYDFAYPVIASGSSGGLGISALAGWYGTSVLDSRFGATDGDQTTGGQISFGPCQQFQSRAGLARHQHDGRHRLWRPVHQRDHHHFEPDESAIHRRSLAAIQHGQDAAILLFRGPHRHRPLSPPTSTASFPR